MTIRGDYSMESLSWQLVGGTSDVYEPTTWSPGAAPAAVLQGTLWTKPTEEDGSDIPEAHFEQLGSAALVDASGGGKWFPSATDGRPQVKKPGGGVIGSEDDIRYMLTGEHGLTVSGAGDLTIDSKTTDIQHFDGRGLNVTTPASKTISVGDICGCRTPVHREGDPSGSRIRWASIRGIWRTGSSDMDVIVDDYSAITANVSTPGYMGGRGVYPHDTKYYGGSYAASGGDRYVFHAHAEDTGTYAVVGQRIGAHGRHEIMRVRDPGGSGDMVPMQFTDPSNFTEPTVSGSDPYSGSLCFVGRDIVSSAAFSTYRAWATDRGSWRLDLNDTYAIQTTGGDVYTRATLFVLTNAGSGVGYLFRSTNGPRAQDGTVYGGLRGRVESRSRLVGQLDGFVQSRRVGVGLRRCDGRRAVSCSRRHGQRVGSVEREQLHFRRLGFRRLRQRWQRDGRDRVCL